MIVSEGLRQLINSPTRYGNVLDLVYTNSDYVAARGVLDIALSDHLLIYVTRKKLKTKTTSKIFLGRTYKNYDKGLFQEQLLDRDWAEMYSKGSAQETWDYMSDQIRHVIDWMCPIKRMKIRDRGEPWLSHELIELIIRVGNWLKNRALLLIGNGRSASGMILKL